MRARERGSMWFLLVCLASISPLLTTCAGTPAGEDEPEPVPVPAVRDLWASFKETLPPLEMTITEDEVVRSASDPRRELRRVEVKFYSQEIEGRKWGHPAVIFMPRDPIPPARRGEVVIVGQRSVDGLATGPWRGSFLGNYPRRLISSCLGRFSASLSRRPRSLRRSHNVS